MNDVISIMSGVLTDNLEIVKDGRIDISGSIITANPGAGNFVSGSYTHQIAHNLNFKPIIYGMLLEFGTNNNQWSFCMPSFSFIGGPAAVSQWFNFEVYCDSTYVYAVVSCIAIGQPINFAAVSGVYAQYYLLREKTS